MIDIINITVDAPTIDVTPRMPKYEPDPDWVFISDDGTVYTWVFDVDEPVVVPELILRTKEEEMYCEECGHLLEDTYKRTWYETPLGEVVEPGRRPVKEAGRIFVQGPKEWSGEFTVVKKDAPDVGVVFNLADVSIAGDANHGMRGQALVTGYRDASRWTWIKYDDMVIGSFQGSGAVTHAD